MQRFVLFILLAIFSYASSGQNNAVKPCSAPECSQFDFWLGDWDLTWNDTSRGTNTIKKILDGCVVNENFNSPSGNYSGMSWSVYNSRKAVWEQTWVDSQGGYIVLTGQYSNGQMILSTQPTMNAQGKKIVSRMIFYNIGADSFDWNWESSGDNKTWKLNWKIHYQRKR